MPDQSAQSEYSLDELRLPWGYTQAVAPDSILSDPTPTEMRFWEDFEQKKQEKINNHSYLKAPFYGVNLHQKYDQECMRFAQLVCCFRNNLPMTCNLSS
ncbi:hypothetical protein CN228_15130 [Pseudomonas syringae pv. actinidiae str. Shaanxi_M228]|nr:hypothetical protein CN228_15130 [Pseudomonas syringae pv. actinidiae str. Shaanxi_M228]